MKDIDKLFDSISETATFIAKKQEAIPICFAAKDNNLTEIPLVFRDQAEKEHTAFFLKQLFRRMQPDAVVCIMEARAWTATPGEIQPDTDLIGSGHAKAPSYAKIKQRKPDDILVASLFTKDKTVTRTWNIKEYIDHREVGKMKEIQKEKGEDGGIFDFSDVFD